MGVNQNELKQVLAIIKLTKQEQENNQIRAQEGGKHRTWEHWSDSYSPLPNGNGEGGWVLWRPQGTRRQDRTGGLQGGARSGTHGGAGSSGGHGRSVSSGGHGGLGSSGGHGGSGSSGGHGRTGVSGGHGGSGDSGGHGGAGDSGRHGGTAAAAPAPTNESVSS